MATAEFSQFAGILSAALSQHHLSGFEIAQLEFHHLHYLCSYFILEGSKITADGDVSPEIKRCLLLGRKVMTNLDSILKSRGYFANKGPPSQGYGFSSSHVWM